MGKVGFVILLIGGILLILAGASFALDSATRTLIADLINFVAYPMGTLIADLLWVLTSFGGIGVVLGAILWFAAGEGCLARIGKFVAGTSAFGATYEVIMAVAVAYTSHIFDLPPDQILLYFAGLGIGFTAVFFIFAGLFIGAGRRKRPKPEAAAPPPQTAQDGISS